MTDTQPTTRRRYSAHLYLEAKPLGDYVAQCRMVPDTLKPDEEVLFALDLKRLFTLRQHIDVAIDRILDRQISDAICGDCDLCKNTRMVDVGKNGRPWTEHCPACHPKLEAAQRAFAEGRPPGGT